MNSFDRASVDRRLGRLNLAKRIAFLAFWSETLAA
jgi:hypothetical protein